MPSASALRLQIETTLAQRIPSALTPAPKVLRPVAPTGVPSVDVLLDGGLPIGAITEMVGPESSGRTSLALSFVAGITRAGSVGAWVDVSNTLDPESAAAAGVDLERLLWVRCGVAAAQTEPPAAYRFALPEQYLIPPPVKQGLHGGGCGGHPRNEVKGLAEAVTGLLRPEALAPRCAEPQRKVRPERAIFEPPAPPIQPLRSRARAGKAVGKPWPRMEQALRAADLLLQAGGFSVVVLDMASLAPEYAARVPLATWFRYRAAAERTQASVLLLTQHSCAKSSGELLLRFQPSRACSDEATVFTGSAHRLEVERRRFSETPANVVPLRKPPQSVTAADWRSQCGWAGPR
jgi:recombination protein RecA